MRAFAALLALLVARSAGAQSREASPSAGATAELTIPSRTYPQGRRVWVHTPAGYPASCRPDCNLIVAFDGATYLDTMALPRVLDSLIAIRRTGPAVAVLVDNEGPPGRIADLANSHRFADFLATELLPWIQAHYSVTHAAEHTLVTGSSAGGLAAAYVAMKYPARFGNVLSQSGAFWRGNEASNGRPYEWLTQQFASAPKLAVRFFLDVGSRETVGAMGGAAPSILDANRRLHAVLKSKGYEVSYLEVPGGVHSPESWRGRLPVGIAALLPFASAPPLPHASDKAP